MSITYSISDDGVEQLAKDALVTGGGPYTLTLDELEAILSRRRTNAMTPDDRLAMVVEGDTQLVIGAEDHSPTKLAKAAGRALICNAIANVNCASLRDAVDAHDYMDQHA